MKYWIYLNGEVPGSYEPADLAAIPGFGETALVCPSTDNLAERRWERAGAYPDIIEALRGQPKAPLPPPEPLPVHITGAPRAVTPDDILNDSSQKIFRHVTELMKELENRREERALNQSLQRRVSELSGELTALRERAGYLQGRADLIGGFQDREREMQEALARARADLHETRAGAARLDADLAQSLAELQTARRAIEQLKSEAGEREGILSDLSRRLSEKEAMLAKAFGLIRRLEESLAELLPGATSGIAREAPSYPMPHEAAPAKAEAAPQPPVVPAPIEDIAPAPPEVIPAPPEAELMPLPPPWQEKLSGFLSSIKDRLQR